MVVLHRLRRLLLQIVDILIRVFYLFSIRLHLQPRSRLASKPPYTDHRRYSEPRPPANERHFTYRRLGIATQLPLPVPFALFLLLQLIILVPIYGLLTCVVV